MILIEYVTKTLENKEARKWFKHTDTAINSINPLPLDDVKVLYNPHNNPRQSLYFCKANSSTYFCADGNVIYDKISHSYDRTTS